MKTPFPAPVSSPVVRHSSFLSRLSPRERRLVFLTVGVALVLGNLFLLSYLFGARRELAATLGAKRLAATNAGILRAEAPTWDGREAWLRAHQPKLVNSPQAAGGQLLAQVQRIAAERRVTLESPQILPPEGVAYTPGGVPRPYQPVAVTFNVRGDWAAMVGFLATLQANPEEFFVPENFSLRSDKNNPAMLFAEGVRIARWFAPTSGGS